MTLNTKINASVPLLVEMQYFTPIYFEKVFSNFFTYEPKVNSLVFINFFHSVKILDGFLNSYGKYSYKERTLFIKINDYES